MLRPFLPLHPTLAAPRAHGPVARVRPAGAGFLVAEQVVEAVAFKQLLQHAQGRAVAHQQGQAPLDQGLAQFTHTGAGECELARMKLRAVEPLGLHDPQRRCYTLSGCGQGRVVQAAQVALEPNQALGHTTCASACATRSTLPCVRPATHRRPERMRYTACSSRKRSTCSALKPV